MLWSDKSMKDVGIELHVIIKENKPIGPLSYKAMYCG
jgi:hypothetical protein